MPFEVRALYRPKSGRFAADDFGRVGRNQLRHGAGLIADNVVSVEVDARDGRCPCVTGENGFFFVDEDLERIDVLGITLRFASGGSATWELPARRWEQARS